MKKYTPYHNFMHFYTIPLDFNNKYIRQAKSNSRL